MDVLAANGEKTMVTLVTIASIVGVLAVIGGVMLWVELFSKLSQILSLLRLQDERWKKRYGEK